MALKILYLNGEMSLIELSHHICLSPGMVDEIFQCFRKEQLCEVKGMVGGSHRIAASMQGKVRAAGLLSLSQYAGPAPVSLGDYRLRVRAQSVQQTVIQLRLALRDETLMGTSSRLRISSKSTT